MYRVLIIDDEPIVANGVYYTITDHTEWDLECHKTYFVKHALELVDKFRFDIVVSDMKMPGLTGVELQKQVISKWPSCKFIFFTGFDNFQNIQSAVQGGNVVDYILKNDGDEKIVEAIDKAIRILNSEHSNQLVVEKARAQINVALPALRKEFFTRLILDEPMQAKELRRWLQEMNADFREDEFVLMLCGRLDEWNGELSYKDRQLLLYAADNIVTEYFGTRARIMCVHVEETKLVWFMQVPGQSEMLNQHFDKNKQWSLLIQFVYEMLESIQNTCLDLLSITLSFVMHAKPAAWNHARHYYRQLTGALGSGLLLKQCILMVDENRMDVAMLHGETLESTVEQEWLRRQMEQLSFYLEIGKTEGFDEIFSDLERRLKQQSFAWSRTNAEWYYTFHLFFVSWANKWPDCLNDSMIGTIRQLSDWSPYSGWESVFKEYRTIAHALLQERENDRDKRSQDIVFVLHQYIQTHIGGDLSLTKLAEIVHYSPAYLSRLYIQMTGNSILKYITDARMSEARKWLANSDKLIHQIGYEIGYESPAHFSKYFRKHHNMSPQEYREQCK